MYVRMLIPVSTLLLAGCSRQPTETYAANPATPAPMPRTSIAAFYPDYRDLMLATPAKGLPGRSPTNPSPSRLGGDNSLTAEVPTTVTDRSRSNNTMPIPGHKPRVTCKSFVGY